MRRSPTIALVAMATVVLGAALLGAAGARAAELVRDGSFENGIGNSGWAQQDNRLRYGTPICSTTPGLGPGQCGDDAFGGNAAPRTGSWWTWFGGFTGLLDILNPHHESSLRQDVVLAPGTPATLSFWLWFGRTDSASVLHVSLGDTLLFAVRGDDARFKHGYTRVTIPIHPSVATGAPQMLLFAYTGIVPPLQYHVVNLDDVSLQVADADLGVALASAPATVVQGQTFTTTLAVTNTGPHAATDVEAEFPLPVGATLVGLAGDGACSAPETAPGFVAHCSFGTVPAGGAKSVAISLFATTVGTVAMSATTNLRTGDPNGANQVAHSAVTVVPPPQQPDVPTPPKQDDEQPKQTCTKPRRFSVPLRTGAKGSGVLLGKHKTKGARIRSARLTGPKKFKATKPKHTRTRVTLDFRRVPAGRYTLRTRVRVAGGRTVTVKTTYTACGPDKATSTKSKSTSKSKTTSKSKSKSKSKSTSKSTSK